MPAIVLLSGGLDSAVILAKVCAEQKSCLAISFDYGQRHRIELECAKKLATHYQVPHEIISIDPVIFRGASSSLTSTSLVPQKDKSLEEIFLQPPPSTYVPARNTLFLTFALVKAEIHQAEEIYIGSNANDFISYPDCRPVYFAALQELFNLAIKPSEKNPIPKVVTPWLYSSKVQIVQEGQRLGVPFELTSSCYDPLENGQACLYCDACKLRVNAFEMLANSSQAKTKD